MSAKTAKRTPLTSKNPNTANNGITKPIATPTSPPPAPRPSIPELKDIKVPSDAPLLYHEQREELKKLKEGLKELFTPDKASSLEIATKSKIGSINPSGIGNSPKIKESTIRQIDGDEKKPGIIKNKFSRYQKLIDEATNFYDLSVKLDRIQEDSSKMLAETGGDYAIEGNRHISSTIGLSTTSLEKAARTAKKNFDDRYKKEELEKIKKAEEEKQALIERISGAREELITTKDTLNSNRELDNSREIYLMEIVPLRTKALQTNTAIHKQEFDKEILISKEQAGLLSKDDEVTKAFHNLSNTDDKITSNQFFTTNAYRSSKATAIQRIDDIIKNTLPENRDLTTLTQSEIKNIVDTLESAKSLSPQGSEFQRVKEAKEALEVTRDKDKAHINILQSAVQPTIELKSLEKEFGEYQSQQTNRPLPEEDPEVLRLSNSIELILGDRSDDEAKHTRQSIQALIEEMKQEHDAEEEQKANVIAEVSKLTANSHQLLESMCAQDNKKDFSEEINANLAQARELLASEDQRGKSPELENVGAERSALQKLQDLESTVVANDLKQKISQAARKTVTEAEQAASSANQVANIATSLQDGQPIRMQLQQQLDQETEKLFQAGGKYHGASPEVQAKIKETRQKVFEDKLKQVGTNIANLQQANDELLGDPQNPNTILGAAASSAEIAEAAAAKADPAALKQDLESIENGHIPTVQAGKNQIAQNAQSALQVAGLKMEGGSLAVDLTKSPVSEEEIAKALEQQPNLQKEIDQALQVDLDAAKQRLATQVGRVSTALQDPSIGSALQDYSYLLGGTTKQQEGLRTKVENEKQTAGKKSQVALNKLAVRITDAIDSKSLYNFRVGSEATLLTSNKILKTTSTDKSPLEQMAEINEAMDNLLPFDPTKEQDPNSPTKGESYRKAMSAAQVSSQAKKDLDANFSHLQTAAKLETEIEQFRSELSQYQQSKNNTPARSEVPDQSDEKLSQADKLLKDPLLKASEADLQTLQQLRQQLADERTAQQEAKAQQLADNEGKVASHLRSSDELLTQMCERKADEQGSYRTEESSAAITQELANARQSLALARSASVENPSTEVAKDGNEATKGDTAKAIESFVGELEQRKIAQENANAGMFQRLGRAFGARKAMATTKNEADEQARKAEESRVAAEALATEKAGLITAIQKAAETTKEVTNQARQEAAKITEIAENLAAPNPQTGSNKEKLKQTFDQDTEKLFQPANDNQAAGQYANQPEEVKAKIRELRGQFFEEQTTNASQKIDQLLSSDAQKRLGNDQDRIQQDPTKTSANAAAQETAKIADSATTQNEVAELKDKLKAISGSDNPKITPATDYHEVDLIIGDQVQVGGDQQLPGHLGTAIQRRDEVHALVGVANQYANQVELGNDQFQQFLQKPRDNQTTPQQEIDEVAKQAEAARAEKEALALSAAKKQAEDKAREDLIQRAKNNLVQEIGGQDNVGLSKIRFDSETGIKSIDQVIQGGNNFGAVMVNTNHKNPKNLIESIEQEWISSDQVTKENAEAALLQRVILAHFDGNPQDNPEIRRQLKLDRGREKEFGNASQAGFSPTLIYSVGKFKQMEQGVPLQEGSAEKLPQKFDETSQSHVNRSYSEFYNAVLTATDEQGKPFSKDQQLDALFGDGGPALEAVIGKWNQQEQSRLDAIEQQKQAEQAQQLASVEEEEAAFRRAIENEALGIDSDFKKDMAALLQEMEFQREADAQQEEAERAGKAQKEWRDAEEKKSQEEKKQIEQQKQAEQAQLFAEQKNTVEQEEANFRQGIETDEAAFERQIAEFTQKIGTLRAAEAKQQQEAEAAKIAQEEQEKIARQETGADLKQKIAQASAQATESIMTAGDNVQRLSAIGQDLTSESNSLLKQQIGDQFSKETEQLFAPGGKYEKYKDSPEIVKMVTDARMDFLQTKLAGINEKLTGLEAKSYDLLGEDENSPPTTMIGAAIATEDKAKELETLEATTDDDIATLETALDEVAGKVDETTGQRVGGHLDTIDANGQKIAANLAEAHEILGMNETGEIDINQTAFNTESFLKELESNEEFQELTRQELERQARAREDDEIPYVEESEEDLEDGVTAPPSSEISEEDAAEIAARADALDQELEQRRVAGRPVVDAIPINQASATERPYGATDQQVPYGYNPQNQTSPDYQQQPYGSDQPQGYPPELQDEQAKKRSGVFFTNWDTNDKLLFVAMMVMLALVFGLIIALVVGAVMYATDYEIINRQEQRVQPQHQPQVHDLEESQALSQSQARSQNIAPQPAYTPDYQHNPQDVRRAVNQEQMAELRGGLQGNTSTASTDNGHLRGVRAQGQDREME